MLTSIIVTQISRFQNCYNQVMTYASIILPYELPKKGVKNDPKKFEKMKGNLSSALKKGGAAVKNAIQNPSETIKTLSKYMTDNSPEAVAKKTIMITKIVNGVETAQEVTSDNVNKFSGIALAQMLSDGKVTNQAALDYLFLGFAPALDQQALSMGYSGVTQMKDAIANGKINVGSFVSGFSKTLKSATDYANGIKNKMEQKKNNIIEIDIVLNHNEQYQSEAPDRRVEKGPSYAEVLHNLPEIFSLECDFSELKNKGKMSTIDFKGYLKQLRDSKQPFGMVFSDGGNEIEEYKDVVLQNFNPSVLGARSGLDYTLELKKVHIGSVELTPITIQKAPQEVVESVNQGAGISAGISGNVNMPNYVNNPTSTSTKLTPNTNQSLWAHTTDLGGGNALQGALKLMGLGND